MSPAPSTAPPTGPRRIFYLGVGGSRPQPGSGIRPGPAPHIVRPKQAEGAAGERADLVRSAPECHPKNGETEMRTEQCGQSPPRLPGLTTIAHSRVTRAVGGSGIPSADCVSLELRTHRGPAAGGED